MATPTRQFYHPPKQVANFSLQIIGVLVLICIAVVSPTTSGSSRPCESIEFEDWDLFGSTTCFMHSTAIDSTHFSITSDRDETVGGFDAKDNKKMEFLPANLGEKFPNLVRLNAFNCSIKEISKENFKGLSTLQELHLEYNQIEKIDDDTFEYLSAVEWIHLRESKIKKLNSRAFASLSKLTWVDLENNDCINENFDGATRIAGMPRVVNEKCGFPKGDLKEGVVAALTTKSGSGGPCEWIENEKWFGIESIKTCYMKSTVIDSAQFSITSARSETVGGLNAWKNKKMEYLPGNLGEKFPNLLGLQFYNCSIKQISKENFKGLNNLRWLLLASNQIEKIDDDTFEFIPAVERIYLSGNKIKKLNGRAFASLSKLTTVDLRDTVCINENFVGAARIAGMPRVVNEKCGFTGGDMKVLAEAPKPNACGVPVKVTQTIVRGENFDRGDFPWMVALYRRLKRRRPEYFCGGSLISDRHVLTAAHCLENLVPRDIAAVFGAYDLEDQFEDGRFGKSPSRIFVHDHWNPQTVQFDADIAMLLMPEKIVFSNFVQPICIWESQEAPTASTGILPGWGQSQNTSRVHETIPTKLQLPIHTNEHCFLKFDQLAQVSSNRTFCAGSADGRGPCFGDGGGGFYVLVGNVFYLRGIVSAAWDVNIYGECLLKKFTIYTDVLKFKEWIDATKKRD